MTPKIKSDFHIHLLPGLDDGAATVSDSMAMLQALSKQGIEKAIVTPHYYAHRESVSHWLARRMESAKLLSGEIVRAERPLPTLYFGAEVALERDLSRVDGLEQLRMGETQYLLIELPYASFQPWIPEEIYALCYRFQAKPMIAHLDRFYVDMTREQLSAICSLEDVVIQVNNDALQSHRSMKFVRRLIQEGVTVVFGSDAHNLTTRPVNFQIANSRLAAKLKPEALGHLLQQTEDIFRGASVTREMQIVL